jgi:pyrroline-5-carboxylate reductase
MWHFFDTLVTENYTSIMTITMLRPSSLSSTLAKRCVQQQYQPKHMAKSSGKKWNSTSSSSSSNGSGVYEKIAFCGAGQMAQAMIDPLIRTGLQPASRVAVFDVSNKILRQVVGQHPGIQMAGSIPELVKDADLLVLAVKPQNISPEFLAQFSPDHGAHLRPDLTLLSILAGTPISRFTASGNFSRVARSMPNTPAMIGQGMTVWASTNNLTAGDRDRIQKILSCFGKSIFVDDEKFIDMSTSISGSGPAYVFMLMEAMIDAGVHMGFSRDTSTTLVYHTLLGSTLYAMEKKEHPAILRNSVTSPAGTTASAMYELESGKFRTVIQEAIWACYRRSLEMGNLDSNVGPGRVKFQSPPTGEMKSQSDPNGNGNGNSK